MRRLALGGLLPLLAGAAIAYRELAAIVLAALAPRVAGHSQGAIHGYRLLEEIVAGGLEPVPTSGRLCVNPLTWRHDRGAVFFEGSQPPAPRPGFASARCDRGVLRVELAAAPPRDFASRLLDHALGDGNYHPIEYGLFFVDLRENAALRVAAFRSARAQP